MPPRGQNRKFPNPPSSVKQRWTLHRLNRGISNPGSSWLSGEEKNKKQKKNIKETGGGGGGSNKESKKNKTTTTQPPPPGGGGEEMNWAFKSTYLELIPDKTYSSSKVTGKGTSSFRATTRHSSPRHRARPTRRRPAVPSWPRGPSPGGAGWRPLGRSCRRPAFERSSRGRSRRPDCVPQGPGSLVWCVPLSPNCHPSPLSPPPPSSPPLTSPSPSPSFLTTVLYRTYYWDRRQY